MHPKDVICPKCGAKPNNKCTTKSGVETESHTARFKLAQQPAVQKLINLINNPYAE